MPVGEHGSSSLSFPPPTHHAPVPAGLPTRYREPAPAGPCACCPPPTTRPWVRTPRRTPQACARQSLSLHQPETTPPCRRGLRPRHRKPPQTRHWGSAVCLSARSAARPRGTRRRRPPVSGAESGPTGSGVCRARLQRRRHATRREPESAGPWGLPPSQVHGMAYGRGRGGIAGRVQGRRARPGSQRCGWTAGWGNLVFELHHRQTLPANGPIGRPKYLIRRRDLWSRP